MRKWTIRICVLFFVALLTTAMLYETSTHVMRGWLRGEAFYDGRPTSYWRPCCDEWIARFDTPDKAARYVPPGVFMPMLDDHQNISWVVMPTPARPATFWNKVMDRFRSEDDWIHDQWPPKVLLGHPGAEPVLEELAKEDQYKVVAERALRYAKENRKRELTEKGD